MNYSKRVRLDILVFAIVFALMFILEARS